MRKNITGKRPDMAVIALLVLSVLLPVVMHVCLGTDPLGPTYYNTYTRQAMAWREGLTHLPEDVPALELAVYKGDYYVSFPPVPSVVLWPLTFLFGMDTPDNLLMIIYMSCASISLYYAFRKKEMDSISAAAFAFFLCYASCILPLILNGAVWYHAQLLGFALISVCILCFAYEKPAGGFFCFALSVGCRPFNIVYGVVIGLIYLLTLIRNKKTWRQIIRHLLPGILLGLLVACGYMLYNTVRFHNPLEFGHNYLPEFSFQGGVQFSLSHIANNLRSFVLRMPFYTEDGGKTLHLQQFGFCMFIANPVLLFLIIWFIKDVLRGECTAGRVLILCGCTVHLFLLLLHRTFGGYQFGARYTCDLICYGALYLIVSKRRMTGAQAIIWLFSLAFSVYGTLTLHL